MDTLIAHMDLGMPPGSRPGDTRVVVAMSGGVDSSVVAALYKARGFDVVGVTLQLYDHGEAVAQARSCCAGRDIHDARQVADAIGISHYVLDYESRFKESVIDDFVETYLAGETPVPCVRCNQTVKFRDLLGVARDLGAEAMATGHYVRRVIGESGAELHRGADPVRDQSYFLFATTREQLEFLRFPLGELNKTQTRALADHFNLPVAEKPDSQDICFVPQGSYADVIKKLRPDAGEAGDIVDLHGNVLGRHDGIINFTVGQRRGIGIGGAPAPRYIVELRPELRQVVVGPREDLLIEKIHVQEINWLSKDTALHDGREVQVKVRSTRPPAQARVFLLDNGAAEISLVEPETGVAPGQACVIYDGERILGGGWIARESSVTALRDQQELAAVPA